MSTPRVIPRLPVHILLDIDRTLLKAHRMKSDGNGNTLYKDVTQRGRNIALETIDVRLDTGKCFRYDIQPRPHLAAFMSHVVTKHGLDTDRIEVYVSLFTRRPGAYCTAIARYLNALLGRPEKDQVIHRCFGGEYCTDAWNKSVAVTGSPFTTLLVDDTADNFIAAEFMSGRCVLVPSFDPIWGAEDDELLRTDVGVSRRDGCCSCLLPVVEQFAKACHSCAEEIRSCQEVPPASEPDSCALLGLNLLTHASTDAYSAAWQQWHGRFDAELTPLCLTPM